MTPDGLFELQSAILLCVCEQMDALADSDEDYAGCPCLQYVSAGAPEIDCCEDSCDGAGGRLTVHLENVYPSDTFPEPSPGFLPCSPQSWVASVVVTVARCVSITDDSGNIPPTTDLEADSRTQAIDAYAVLTALSCCVVDSPPAGKRKRRVKIEASTPLDSEGGCGGIEVRAFVEAGVICSCGTTS